MVGIINAALQLNQREKIKIRLKVRQRNLVMKSPAISQMKVCILNVVVVLKGSTINKMTLKLSKVSIVTQTRKPLSLGKRLIRSTTRCCNPI